MRDIFCAILMLCPLIASAKPMLINDHIKAINPAGKASLHKFLFHVYDAEFWSDTPGWSMDTPYALDLKYFVSIDKDDFLSRTIKELRRNPEVTDAMLEEYERKLGYIYPDVEKGDTITALYVPNEGLVFSHNNNTLGWIRDVKLVKPFMGIWLGKHTSEPSLRDALLK